MDRLRSIREDAYTSPSFNSYSTDRLAEIAVQIAAEKSGDDNENDDDFEFSLVREDKEFSAENFVYDGPIYPVFNRDLLLRDGGGGGGGDGDDQCESSIKVPLSQLLLEDRRGGNENNPPSCSSSEADELESVPAGTYCVWCPNPPDLPSPTRCKKSRSTGSASTRWKFRDLMRRSKSDGKESLVFLTPKNRDEKLPAEIPKKLKGKGGNSSGSGATARSAHEALYVRNRAVNEVDRKKSYLPYRRDLVGFFINANALARGFPHF
ncbi:hypothetical protein SASPL_144788 [Salvia splendens]|uniref:Uncharacterized protein n=1 Tax=Salvia splendens TaxID=180675 RepID=A0A8X8WFY0_SALSN|nr:uncharacterized protein LOC121774201 [Salvia splendens]KAG6394207.1 hypothetical protein SASPL_144788 [Salvia splendens]